MSNHRFNPVARRARGLALLGLLGLLAFPPAALANGIGDLYVAVDDGVLELSVATAQLVTKVDLTPTPRSIAFSNDGRSLYAANGTRRLDVIDIETISFSGKIELRAAATLVVVPKGETALAAGPQSRRLALVNLEDRSLRETEPLPGTADILAADRRDRRVLAAQSGASWVAIVDADDASVVTAKVPGRIVAAAADRSGGGGYLVTSSPNRLVRIDYASAKVQWDAALPGRPIAVASMVTGPIVAVAGAVAGAGALWTVIHRTAAPWATLPASVVALVPNDDGGIMYAALPDRILALDLGGEVRRTLPIAAADGLHGLAAVPAPGSSLGAAGEGPAIEPPATSTLPDRLSAWVAGRAPLLGALAVSAIVLVAGLLVIRRRAVG